MADQVLDAKGLNCPLPILQRQEGAEGHADGRTLEVQATDPGAVKDFEAFCRTTGNELMESRNDRQGLHLPHQADGVRRQRMSAPLYILLCSGEHEKVQMAAMMASVAAVSERPVEVFVSMNAILAFAKDAPATSATAAALLRSDEGKGRARCHHPVPQGKELGDLKMWACSMALDVPAGTRAGSKPDLFDGPWG